MRCAPRLTNAERSLATKPTKKAAEDQRIATDKIAKAFLRLGDQRRTEAKPADSRIFPGDYAPVMVLLDGVRTVVPMRYQYRPAGKPAFYDTKFPGTYNARRDNLRGFWKDLYGTHHGVMVVDPFYENVTRQDAEGQPHNVRLEFVPQNHEPMLIACLWSRWRGREGEPDLLSFAAITDEPPPEVAAAGHDRCIITIKPEHVDSWLRPGGDLEAMGAILGDPIRPYYEHALAA